jgi:1-deoxy-D-xylulose-5-phosphate reductoisomerase
MASAAVLWFGEKMSAVPLRNNKAAVSAARTVTVLGATGSIGDSTMDLLRGDRERYQVEALTANSNVEALAKLAIEFGARFAAVADASKLGALKAALAGTRTECGAGESAIIEAAARPADWVMAAVSGAAGLKPALAAVDRGAAVALANKECLVCAGDFFMQRAAKAGACILPADSEHNALFQALSSGNRDELVRVIITASGGPFRTWASADIEQATGAGAETSELEHGPEDHHRFGVDDEQGARSDRGLLFVRAEARRDRCARASAVDHPRHGRILRPVGGRPTRRAGHAHSDRSLPGMARSDRRSLG